MRKHGVKGKNSNLWAGNWFDSSIIDHHSVQGNFAAFVDLAHSESSCKRTSYGLDLCRETSSTIPTLKKGLDFMQRSCYDQVRSRVCLFMSLSVVGWVWADQTRQRFQQTITGSWRSISKRLRSNVNPEGVNWSQLLSTKCSQKVIWSYQRMPKSAGESLMCVVGQRKLRAWLSGTLFSLWSKESECLSKVLTGRSGLAHSWKSCLLYTSPSPRDA